MWKFVLLLFESVKSIFCVISHEKMCKVMILSKASYCSDCKVNNVLKFLFFFSLQLIQPELLNKQPLFRFCFLNNFSLRCAIDFCNSFKVFFTLPYKRLKSVRSLFCSPWLHLFEKYIKNRNMLFKIACWWGGGRIL